MLKNIHHINLLVTDLDAAVASYQRVLGVTDMQFAALPQRGVRTARFRVGESWVVLVQPTDADSVPARHLAEHGQGLFLLSFEVDSLATAVSTVKTGGGHLPSEEPRQGLDNWQVLDLDRDEFYGAQLQLVEVDKNS